MKLEDQIRELRKKYNWSQEQLAEKVGVARQTISKWELGETVPDIKQAQTLARIFRVSLDVLIGNGTEVSADNTEDRRIRTNVTRKRIIVISTLAVCLCLVTVGIFSIINRSRILYPQGLDGNIIISRKEKVQIGNGDAGAIVFRENGKPAIACQLPKEYVSDAETAGLYTDGSGNFIKFNADYAENIINPLLETEYYSYFETHGYHSYMDMARLAMYYDLPKLGILTSKEELHLAGGAQLIREQLCAGQDADYYGISGESTTSGEEMRMYGFALHFENTIWHITLKDYEDNYYFITVKDPDGIGKSIDTISEFLGSIYAGNAIQHSNIQDTVAMQAAKNAYSLYLVTKLDAGEEMCEYCVFQADSTRFVAIRDGAVAGIYDSSEDALKAMLDNPDPGKLSATGIDNLWAYRANDQ